MADTSDEEKRLDELTSDEAMRWLFSPEAVEEARRRLDLRSDDDEEEPEDFGMSAPPSNGS